MSNFNCDLIPPRDQLLLQSYKELYEDLLRVPGISNLVATVTIGVLAPKQIDLNTYLQEEEYINLSKLDVDIISYMSLNSTSGNYKITFNRNSEKPVSKLTLSGEPSSNSMEWNEAIFKFRKKLYGGSTVPSNLLDREILGAINRDLAAASNFLKEDINKRIRENEEEVKKIRDSLKQDHESKMKTLEEEYDKKESELRIREEGIERVSNTDARRKIRQDLNREIDQKIKDFGPSKLINDDFKDLNVIFVSILAMLGVSAIYFIGLMFYKLSSGETQIEVLKYLGIEAGVSSIATVGFFIYYSRWKSNWLNKLLHEEFSLKKYRLDMDRSSWLLESYLELQVAHQKELPEVLVGAITTNLFQSSVEEVATSKHPVEDILSGLTKNSRIKVKSGKHEIELNKGTDQ